jgi:hypothetical protein
MLIDISTADNQHLRFAESSKSSNFITFDRFSYNEENNTFTHSSAARTSPLRPKCINKEVMAVEVSPNGVYTLLGADLQRWQRLNGI